MRDLQAWQDHQYDPGYWAAGNLLPLRQIRKSMPRVGSVFISIGLICGIMTLIGSVALLSQHESPLGIMIVGGCFTAFHLLIGFRFRGSRSHHHPRTHRHT